MSLMAVNLFKSERSKFFMKTKYMTGRKLHQLFSGSGGRYQPNDRLTCCNEQDKNFHQHDVHNV